MKTVFNLTTLWCDGEHEIEILDKILKQSDYKGNYTHTLSTGTKVYDYERTIETNERRSIYLLTVYVRGNSNE